MKSVFRPQWNYDRKTADRFPKAWRYIYINTFYYNIYRKEFFRRSKIILN